MESAAEVTERFVSVAEAIREQEYTPKPEPKVDVLKRPLVDRAVSVSIKLGRPGIHKAIDSERIEFASEDTELGDAEINKKVDREMIRVTKKLIDCQEYKNIVTLDRRIKRLIKLRCIQSLVRRGIFLLSIGLTKEVDAEVQSYKVKRKGLIELYKAVYPRRVEEALARLGPEGDPKDYPTWDQIEQMFTFDFQYFKMSAPTMLGDVDEAILQREENRITEQIQSALEIGRQGLYEVFGKLVSDLTQKLTVEPGESPKGLSQPMIDRLNDFMRVFDAQNMTGDVDLKGFVEKAKALMSGVDAKDLRAKDADTFRAEIKKGLDEINTGLGSLIVEKPSRAITFDD